MLEIPGYTITRQIHEGRRSLIYQGARNIDHLPVIIKALKNKFPTLSESLDFQKEYNFLQNAGSYGAVRAYAMETLHPTTMIVMEDFGGISLDKCPEIPKLPLSEQLALFVRIADVLGHIHHQSLVHKDIHPANIIWNSETGQAKLIDFAVSARLSKGKTDSPPMDALEGNLAYISPEQTGRMNRSLDFRTDLYSLGVTFYELLTGQLPFTASDPMELVYAHFAKTPPPPNAVNPRIPVILSNIVLKLMAKMPEHRYQSAMGLKADLEKCLEMQRSTGEIPVFKLGQKDASDQFRLPNKLFNRGQEIQSLLVAYDCISLGAREVVMVTGNAGVGKTSLVKEIRNTVVSRGGFFISGKCDPLKTDIPYAPVIFAFRKLVLQLLSLSANDVGQWKKNLTEVLGVNAQVVTDVIPELKMIIDAPPPISVLSAGAARNRFHVVFQNFVGVFAAKNHPLVIFMDDLQWADQSTLKLLELLAASPEADHLLMICAYRPGEIAAGHPLTAFLNQIRQSGVHVEDIALHPLDLASVEQLVSETLLADVPAVSELAALCFKRTYGNPFFLDHLLMLMHDTGGIFFNHQKQTWEWNIEALRKVQITDNVADLMVDKIKKLPEESLRVLGVAACIGNYFDLATLSLADGMAPRNIAAALSFPLEEGLVEPFSDVDDYHSTREKDHRGLSYRFSHDRIHQAIYSLLDSEKRANTHLLIGRLLQAHPLPDYRSDRIFDIATHWNLARARISDKRDLEQAAELNLQAGIKAKKNAAFESAYYYFKAGIEALGENSWAERYPLSISLYTEAVEAACLNSDFVSMETMAEIVLAHALSWLDKIKIYEIRVMALIAQNRLPEAIDTGLSALKGLGIRFPENPGVFHVFIDLVRTKFLLKHKTATRLIGQKLMENPEKIACMRMLTCIASAAFFSVPRLLPLITFEQIRLTLKHGIALDSAPAFAILGLIECGVTGNIQSGGFYGEVAEEMLKRLENRELETKVHVILNSQIRHWLFHAEKTLTPLLDAYQSGLETGDFEYAAYAVHIYCCNSFCLGRNLAALENEFAAYGQTIRRLNQKTAFNFHRIWHQCLTNLLGKTRHPEILAGEIYNAEQMMPIHMAANDRTSMFDAGLHQMILSYLFEDYSQALINARKAEKYADGVTGMLYVPVMVFYATLTRLACCRLASGRKKRHLLRKVVRDRKKMRNWACFAPENFLHKLNLMDAEYYRVTGDEKTARNFYSQAIPQAIQNGYPGDQAIANECYARFWLERGEKDIGYLYLARARQGYQVWGADAKVKFIDKKYSAGFTNPLNTMVIETGLEFPVSAPKERMPASIDTISVVKAAQVISGEIQLDALLKKLMAIVIENAGAESGSLLIKRENKLLVAAEKRQNDDEIRLLDAVFDDNAHLPSSIIHFVERTREPIFFDDASENEFFSKDPYIKLKRPKSVLCLPVIHQNNLVGILYAENNLTTAAFTPNSRRTLEIIASQAAISIDHALIYEELKRAESKWRTLIRTAKEGFIEFDSEAYITDVNPEMCSIMGMERSKLIGRNLLSTVDDKNLEIFKKELALRKQGKRSTYEMSFTRPDNSEVHCLVKATPIYENNAQVGSFAMVTDITERKLAEKEIRQLNEELEERVRQRTEELAQSLEKLKATQKHLVESEKMVSLGQLVAGVAHEVNTPLGVAVTAASYLNEKTRALSQDYASGEISQADFERYIQAAEESTRLVLTNLNRAAELVRSFKQVAVDQSAEEKRIFDVKQYIDEIMVSVRPGYKNILHDIEVICPEQLKVKTYPGAFAQVLTNLVMNSLIHGFDGREKGLIRIEVIRKETDIVMHYSDNGRGMDEDTVSKIYEPFFTTRRSHGGTGLGMHLVYNLVTQTLGGRIECSSARGQGARFIVSFPQNV